MKLHKKMDAITCSDHGVVFFQWTMDTGNAEAQLRIELRWRMQRTESDEETEVLYSVFSKIESSTLDTRCSSGWAFRPQVSTRFLRGSQRTNEKVIMTEDA